MTAKGRRRLIVLGTMASNPYAGMAWMHMQIAAGLRLLGHDVYYFEATSIWPYDPVRGMRVSDSGYALPYLAEVAAEFGMAGRWAYRRSFSDEAWFGLPRAEAEELLHHADAVLNISGATSLAAAGLKAGRLVYVGTDPGHDELAFAQNDPGVTAVVAEHHDVVTYGENIGTPRSPVPPLPRLRGRCRQPVLLDRWTAGEPSREVFTTVCNWRQTGRDIAYGGRVYSWSKHLEFLKFLDLPRRVRAPVELATNLAEPTTSGRTGEVVQASGVDAADRERLQAHGWRLVDGPALTMGPLPYRDYVRASRAEFTVAKDVNVQLRTGWFSERSACYLAAGRPVITQDTGFGSVLPTGEGLFAFETLDQIVAAFDAIESDYVRHSRTARAIAEEYFRAETVLARLLADLGL
jgi:hypothetical protein